MIHDTKSSMNQRIWRSTQSKLRQLGRITGETQTELLDRLVTEELARQPQAIRQWVEANVPDKTDQ